MPVEISKLMGVRERVTVPLTLKEDGELREETITVFHKPFSQSLLEELDAIERDDVMQPPKITRQLLALGVMSPDITRDGKSIQLTAETFEQMGLPAQIVISRAIWAATFGELVAPRERVLLVDRSKSKAKRKSSEVA